jgi:hypothetical protein
MRVKSVRNVRRSTLVAISFAALAGASACSSAGDPNSPAAPGNNTGGAGGSAGQGSPSGGGAPVSSGGSAGQGGAGGTPSGAGGNAAGGGSGGGGTSGATGGGGGAGGAAGSGGAGGAAGSGVSGGTSAGGQGITVDGGVGGKGGATAQDAAADVVAADGGASASPGNFPERFSAPYVETWNDNDLAKMANSTGHKFFTLAFIINGSGACDPKWNGDTSLTGNGYGGYIDNLRKLGGDVIVSFGGAAGTEIGQACTSVATLQTAYQKVIDQFDLTWIDLDIESGSESDSSSVNRRNQALHNLQVANPSLHVSYTLAVDRQGLPSAQMNLLKNAKSNNVRVDVVNIMAMDYGPCYSDMGQAAIDAAAATQKQLANNGLSSSVGVTPMIGVNDVACEVFSTQNAQELVVAAQAAPAIRLLAYWATGADSNNAYLNIFHSFH